MIYNCKRATLLSIKKDEGKITVSERLQLRIHLILCDPCKRFIQQWEQLKNAPVDQVYFKLSDESRARIQEKLSSL